METFLQDVRFGLRLMRRPLGLSAAVIVALALGIGANTAMFSVVYAVLLKPLPYQNPLRLTVLWEQDPQGTQYGPASANYLDWTAQAHSFESIAGWAGQSLTMQNGDRPLALGAGRVTPNFFAVLGVKPVLGRTFVPGEGGVASAGGPPRVVVLSYRLWQDQFGLDPNILGRVLSLNRAQYSVVGVMPAEFKFLGRRQDLWIPLTLDREDREYHYLFCVARLRDGATLAESAAEMSSIGRRLEQDFPKTNRGWKTSVESLTEWMVHGSLRRTLWLLLAAVGFVLLIACVNVAGLLLSRSAARRREISIRAALGAGQARLIRQLLTESVLYSVSGGAAGLALAWVLAKNAGKFLPATLLPPNTAIELNALVALFTVSVSIGAGILSGLAPAADTIKADLQSSLKDGSRGMTGGRESSKVRSFLLVFQIALAVVLLYGASLTVQSLRGMMRAGLGFHPENVLTIGFTPQADRYNESARIVAFYRQVLENAQALPGVRAAALSSNLPLFDNLMRVSFETEGSPTRDPSELPDVNYQMISPGYPKALGIPVLRGRAFDDTDVADSTPVALVNEAFVKRYLAGSDPVGKHVRVAPPLLGDAKFGAPRTLRIAGVIGDVHGIGSSRQSRSEQLTSPALPEIYVPLTQSQWSTPVLLALKTAGDPAAVAAGARAAIRSADAGQTVRRVASMEDVLSDVAAEPRFRAQLMSVFSGLALVLAAIGIYGVSAFLVARRAHEFGIRIALGATPGEVLKIAVRPVVMLAALGIALGACGALVLGQFMKSLLYGVTSVDALTIAGTGLFLAIVAAGAALLPARKASRVDPMRALRQE